MARYVRIVARRPWSYARRTLESVQRTRQKTNYPSVLLRGCYCCLARRMILSTTTVPRQYCHSNHFVQLLPTVLEEAALLMHCLMQFEPSTSRRRQWRGPFLHLSPASQKVRIPIPTSVRATASSARMDTMDCSRCQPSIPE
jgi:hypothetical protein